jgi:DNA uptake protein ComE-like DNA-binding protein
MAVALPLNLTDGSVKINSALSVADTFGPIVYDDFWFPTTPVLDDFNRANEDPVAGNWAQFSITTGYGQHRLVSNTLRDNTATNAAWNYYSAATFGPDSEVFCTVANPPANGFGVTLLQRFVGVGGAESGISGYTAYFGGTASNEITFEITRFTGGVTVSLASAQPGLTWSAGDKIGFRSAGTELSAWVYKAGAWLKVLAVADSTYLRTGSIGLSTFDSNGSPTIQIDDFGGGTAFTRAVKVLLTPSSTDTYAVQLSEASPTLPAVVVATDSCAVRASEGTPTVIDPNTASFAVTETLAIGETDATRVVSVSLSAADTCACGVTDIIANLQVFTGSSTNNVSVSDALQVRLNGADVVLPPAALSVTDSLAVGLSDVSTSVPSVVASEIISITATDAARAPALTLSVADTGTIGLTEPSDPFTSFGVLESLVVQAAEGAPTVAGSFTFNVTESLAVTLSEGLPSFAQVPVSATESLRIQASEVLTNSATVSAVESLAAQLTEDPSLVKTIAVLDTLAVGDTEAAASIFNNFQQFTASDACVVQIAESVTQLVTFLTQLSTSDTCAVQASESVTAQSAVVGAQESLAVQLSEAAAPLNAFFSVESVAVRLTETGLSIPIVPVNLFTFVAESEPIGFIDDAEPLTWGLFADDSCTAGAEEGTAEYVSVANASPDTWNGTTNHEHKREVPRPSRYRLVGTHEW